MRGLFAFTGLLLVVKFVENISGTVISVEVGQNPMLEGSDHDGHLLQCVTEHNGVYYNIYPDSNATFLEYTGGSRLCWFRILDVNFTHSGEWKINTIVNSSYESDVTDTTASEQISYYLRVKEVQKIQPTAYFDGEDGGYAVLYFQNGFDDITKLYIISNHDDNNTNYVLSDNGNGTSAGLEIYGQHGIRIPINKKWSGNWRLIEESGDYSVISGSFVIKSYPKSENPEKKYEKLSLGDENIRIPSDIYSERKYFELVRPDGEVISLRESEGIYKVRKVSVKYAGIWKARYLSKSSMDILEQEIIVTVVDPRAIDVSVSTTEDNMIRMLCRTNVYTIKYCLFTSPNGTVINVLSGVGNDKYEYFGSGYNGNSKSDPDECGLTIRRPSIHDYGLWKCSVSSSYYSGDILSAYVSTDNLTGKNTERSHVTTEDVYVKRGDNFLIKCSTSESLDYCWLRSPNGTNYSVTKNYIYSPNTLPYFGEGLSVGVCGATIENANDTDVGNWSCRLGVTGGVEIESTVAVTVTESYLTPVHKTINVAYDVPKLVVQLIPSVEASIQYCRWIRPNGHGFYEDNAVQYLRSQNENTCSVSINGWNSEDVGTWDCYARLTTGSDEEFHTTIELVYKTGTFASNMALNIVAICLVITTMLTGCILGYIFYKKRITRSANPPSYYNEFDTSKHFPIPVTEKTKC